MQNIIETLTQFIIDQGAFGVFVASILEEIIVPIPSTLIQTGAGFLFLSNATFDAQALWILLSQISLPAAVGATIGSLPLYALLYWGGMPAVRKFGKYFFVTEDKIERAKKTVLAHKSLLWGFSIVRFIPILPSSFVTAVAGLIRLPIGKYILTTFIGMLVRATYLGIAGWVAGRTVQSATGESSPESIGKYGIIIALFFGLIFLTFAIFRKKNKESA